MMVIIRGPAGPRGRTPSPRGLEGKWLVTLPAWGDRCVDVLLRATLPSVLEAVSAARISYELLVWTDAPQRVLSVLPDDVPVKIMDPPGPDMAFESMSNCHRQALRMASINDRVLLLTADMVVSREVVATCESHVMAGKTLICCVAMRSVDGPPVPIGASGRELLAWGWTNRHQMTRECTWPEGKSYDVWRMYFEKDGEVGARAFLPHPLAVMPRGRQIDFRPTIDVNLAMSFPSNMTHFITMPEEGAAIELSPPDKEFLLTTSMADRYVRQGPSIPAFVRQTNPRHRMFWNKRVVICGAGGDCGDADVVKRLLG